MKTFSLLILFLAAISSNAQDADLILGEWLSPAKDTKVLIYKKGHYYEGKITYGSGAPEMDEENPDPLLRSRKLLGLVILKDFRFDGKGTWVEGTIYDPREGNLYSCKMTLNDANNLNIRGFLGIPLFGRTEIWSRCK